MNQKKGEEKISMTTGNHHGQYNLFSFLECDGKLIDA